MEPSLSHQHALLAFGIAQHETGALKPRTIEVGQETRVLVELAQHEVTVRTVASDRVTFPQRLHLGDLACPGEFSGVEHPCLTVEQAPAHETIWDALVGSPQVVTPAGWQ